MLGKLSLIGLIVAICGFALMYLRLFPQFSIIIALIGGGIAVFSVVAWIIKHNSQKIDVDFKDSMLSKTFETEEKGLKRIFKWAARDRGNLRILSKESRSIGDDLSSASKEVEKEKQDALEKIEEIKEIDAKINEINNKIKSAAENGFEGNAVKSLQEEKEKLLEKRKNLARAYEKEVSEFKEAKEERLEKVKEILKKLQQFRQKINTFETKFDIHSKKIVSLGNKFLGINSEKSAEDLKKEISKKLRQEQEDAISQLKNSRGIKKFLKDKNISKLSDLATLNIGRVNDDFENIGIKAKNIVENSKKYFEIIHPQAEQFSKNAVIFSKALDKQKERIVDVENLCEEIVKNPQMATEENFQKITKGMDIIGNSLKVLSKREKIQVKLIGQILRLNKEMGATFDEDFSNLKKYLNDIVKVSEKTIMRAIAKKDIKEGAIDSKSPRDNLDVKKAIDEGLEIT